MRPAHKNIPLHFYFYTVVHTVHCAQSGAETQVGTVQTTAKPFTRFENLIKLSGVSFNSTLTLSFLLQPTFFIGSFRVAG